MRNCVRLAPHTRRSRRKAKGSNGSLAIHSRRTKAPIRAVLTAAPATVDSEPQPSVGVRVMVKTASISPLVINMAPLTSVRRPIEALPVGSRQSAGTSRTVAMAVATPIGTLIRKTQCQPRVWVTSPPASRPIAAPPAPTKLYTPIALARSRSAGNSETIIPRITQGVPEVASIDEATAPPMPCPNRARIKVAGLVASPHKADATVKMSSPARKTRLRPNRSPRRPQQQQATEGHEVGPDDPGQ